MQVSLADTSAGRAATARTRRRGHTLPDLIVVLAIMLALAAIAVPAMRRLLDSAQVHAAARELRALFATARTTALAESRAVAVRLDAGGATATVVVAGDTIRRAALRQTYGVALRSSRDSMAFGATGLGSGAANLTVVLTRGPVVDSVVVSRLGRVR